MRKTTDITIAAEGRDKGKLYRITEMPAMQAERWATRALMALAKGNAEIPADLMTSGMMGIAAFGIKALGGLDFNDAEPLLAEILRCVKHVPDPNKPMIEVPVGDGNTEEIATVMLLRLEALKLHMDFFTAGSA